MAVGAPVDDAVPTVNQALFIELHKHLLDGMAAALIHGKALLFPIAGGAQLL